MKKIIKLLIILSGSATLPLSIASTPVGYREVIAPLFSPAVLDEFTCKQLLATVNNLKERGQEISPELQRCYDAILQDRAISQEDIQAVMEQLPAIIDALGAAKHYRTHGTLIAHPD